MTTETEPGALFESIPLDGMVPIPEKRGKRTLSQSPAAIKARKQRAEAKAKGGAKPRRVASTSRARGPKSLRPEIGAMLTMLNTALIMSPLGTRPVEAITNPAVMPTRIGDELDAAEIDALASALDAQCRRSPRFRKVIENVLTAGSGGALVTVAGMIAARRAARHGILPPMLDPMLGLALSGDGVGALVAMESAPPPDTTPDPETGETAPAPFDFDSLEG